MPDPKIVHLCPLDKFIPAFVDFAQKHIDASQLFFLFGDIQKYPVILQSNIIHIHSFHHIFLILKFVFSARKIVFHSLLNRNFNYIPFFMPWIFKKSYWIIWGADLYKYRHKKLSLRAFIQRYNIRRFAYIVTGTTGDYDLAVRWYQAQGQHIKCRAYPSNIFNPPASLSKSDNRNVHVMIGNSAAPTNNHEIALDMLSPYKNENIRIFCPLSYGSSEHAQHVISIGKKKFKEKFIPIMDFMPLEQYNALLSDMDIAIFAHKRQQAFGNIIALLGMGKKVYLDKDSTLMGILQENGITVPSLEDFNIERISPELAQYNMKKIETGFSKETLIKSLSSWLN